MREFLFRAYDKGRKEYLSGGNLFIAINTSIYPNKSEVYLDEIRNAGKYKERFIVEQYTGLTDKSGKRIFEGDIVKGVAFSTDFIGVITWIDEIAGFGVRYFNERRTPTAWENSSILKMIQKGHKDQFAAEVIGNIHSNPELLEVSE